MLPEGFEARMRALLGSEYEDFLASFDRPLCTGLRRNPLKTGFTGDLSRFSLSPVPWCPTGFYYDAVSRPGLSPYHAAGLYYLQEPSAMAPAELLDPQPGERVLDLCAAPGGKSTQLAGKLRGKGLLVCNEINAKRAKILSGNIERLGISNALVLNEHPKRLEERFAGYFDKILVDAPCSGEGMFRKEEAAVTDWTEDTNAICANRQLEILTSAAAMLRPGGRLVYSTCTFSPVENEGVISDFLWKNPDFSVEKPDVPFFSPGRPDWVANPAPGLEKTFRLWPHKLLGEALCRRPPPGGGRSARSASAGACGQVPAGADGLLRPDRRGLAGGEAAAVRGRVLSRPAGAAGGKGSAGAARGAGAWRSFEKPLCARARVGAVAGNAGKQRLA